MLALFGFAEYYPNGGWNDFMLMLKDEKTARNYLSKLDPVTTKQEEFHVVNMETCELVLSAKWEKVGEVRKRDGKLIIVSCS